MDLVSEAIRINGRVVYEPFAKQLAYHNSPAPYPLYGGSKGCGKSKALRWDHYLPSLNVPRMKSLILRRKLKELERSHLRFVPEEAQWIGAEWKPSDVGAGVLYFPNGSLIEFGHCQHETDVDQYLSAEYDRMSFDEIVTFTETQYLMITSCLRTTIPGLIARAGGATNPAGSSTGLWVRRRWIDKNLTEDEDEDYDPDDYDYIPALPTDNPHLDWKQYLKQLNRLPPEIRAAYRDGSWDIFRGQFFSDFDRARHVCEFTPAPLSVPRYGGFDWGWSSPGVHLWVCFNPEGYLDVEHEYVFNGNRPKQIDREIGEEIARVTKRERLYLAQTYGDPSADAQNGTGVTRFRTLKKYGVPIRPGDNRRIDGWARLRAWMRDRPDGRPFLRIHPRCQYLIRTFGSVVMNDGVDGDLDTDGEDHALDALRYVVMARQSAPGDRPRPRHAPGTVGALKEELLLAEARRGVLGSHNVRRGAYRYQ